MLLKMRLEDLGHQVDVSFHGGEGCKMVLEYNYDVIVLDLMLPGKNGRQISSELRESSVTTPIIMISAIDERDEATGEMPPGVNGFLVKPFKFEDLNKKISDLFNSRKNNGIQ